MFGKMGGGGREERGGFLWRESILGRCTCNGSLINRVSQALDTR